MKKAIAGVTIDVIAHEGMPVNGYVLVTGKLSGEGKVELARRARAGEVAEHVLAELLVRERKAIAGWIP